MTILPDRKSWTNKKGSRRGSCTEDFAPCPAHGTQWLLSKDSLPGLFSDSSFWRPSVLQERWEWKVFPSLLQDTQILPKGAGLTKLKVWRSCRKILNFELFLVMATTKLEVTMRLTVSVIRLLETTLRFPRLLMPISTISKLLLTPFQLTTTNGLKLASQPECTGKVPNHALQSVVLLIIAFVVDSSGQVNIATVSPLPDLRLVWEDSI